MCIFLSCHLSSVNLHVLPLLLSLSLFICLQVFKFKKTARMCSTRKMFYLFPTQKVFLSCSVHIKVPKDCPHNCSSQAGFFNNFIHERRRRSETSLVVLALGDDLATVRLVYVHRRLSAGHLRVERRRRRRRVGWAGLVGLPHFVE